MPSDYWPIVARDRAFLGLQSSGTLRGSWQRIQLRACHDQMNNLFRKLRGLMGIGLTWGTLWALITATVGLVIGVTVPGSIDPGENPIVMGAIVGLIGLVSGVGFGIILSFAEGRKTILELSLSRAAMWGILGAAALPLLTGMENKLLFIVCPLGAVFASVSVAIARKTELHDARQPKLLK